MRGDIVKLIEAFVRKIANERKNTNQQKQNANKYRFVVKKFGLLEHGNKRGNAESTSTDQRRLKNINDFVNYHDSTTNSAIGDVYALKNIKTNSVAINIIKDEALDDFIKKNQCAVDELNSNIEYQSRIFFQGFLRGWTKRDFEHFNKTVQFYIVL